MKRSDFPLLQSDPALIYFDNAATSQKPQQVIDAMVQFYTSKNAPIKRGIYQLAEKATQAYEDAREKIAQFINAQSNEIVFTSGATESINFIASTWGQAQLQEGDEIVLTQLEHHSNLLPWQQLALKKKLTIKFIPVTVNGLLDLSDIESIITQKTKLVSFLDVSNAIGTTVDVQVIVKRARAVGAKVLIDACQSVPHKKINVKQYDCDFLAFSGHKMLGPTGIGVLFIKKEIQPEVPPYQFGGGMVLQAGYEKSEWLKPPYCYEAGTPPIAQAIGLGAAIDYLNQYVDFEQLKKHEASLCAKLISGLQELPNIRILGPIKQLMQMGHMVSFVHEKYHFHDIGAYLDQHNICVRTGHYCAQPLAQKLQIDGSVRVSFYGYNAQEEIDRLVYAMSLLQ
ncbi:MAG: cysteine desulfurase [Candidatus Babeliales bacterium]